MDIHKYRKYVLNNFYNIDYDRVSGDAINRYKNVGYSYYINSEDHSTCKLIYNVGYSFYKIDV